MMPSQQIQSRNPWLRKPAPLRSERPRNVRNVLLLDNDEPLTYAKVMVDQNSGIWLEATGSELKFMNDNQVWNLVDLSNDAKTIQRKLIFKKKNDMDENIQIYKARLMTYLYVLINDDKFTTGPTV